MLLCVAAARILRAHNATSNRQRASARLGCGHRRRRSLASARHFSFAGRNHGASVGQLCLLGVPSIYAHRRSPLKTMWCTAPRGPRNMQLGSRTEKRSRLPRSLRGLAAAWASCLDAGACRQRFFDARSWLQKGNTALLLQCEGVTKLFHVAGVARAMVPMQRAGPLSLLCRVPIY